MLSAFQRSELETKQEKYTEIPMKKHPFKQYGLALAGLTLAFAGSIASAQVPDILYTFDTTNTVFYTTQSYVTNADLSITTNYTVNTTWKNWYNVNAAFSWSTNDAATNANSGSLAVDFGLDPTDGSGSLAGSQSLFFSGFGANVPTVWSI